MHHTNSHEEKKMFLCQNSLEKINLCTPDYVTVESEESNSKTMRKTHLNIVQTETNEYASSKQVCRSFSHCFLCQNSKCVIHYNPEKMIYSSKITKTIIY